MITTFRTVAPGTNVRAYLTTRRVRADVVTQGGITVFGTFVSLLGGQLISLLAAGRLYTENADCRRILLDYSNGQMIRLLVVGALAGLGGSLVDSLLGATLQRTLYDTERKMVVKTAQLERNTAKDAKIVNIGGADVLSNNGVGFASGRCESLIDDFVLKVNLVASIVTGLLSAALAR